MEEAKDFALVTGASSGIWLAISRELARYGYPLLLVSNEEKKLSQVSAEIAKEFAVQTIALYMDLSGRDSAYRLFDYCNANNIKITILVNNAGMFFFRDIIDTDSDKIETVINLHALCPTLLCRLFGQQMILEKRRGYILNMASIAAQMMMPGIAMYNATKSYLRCFSRAMRHEVFDKGLSITTVCPGAAATGLYKLPQRYMKLGIRLGIIMEPEKLARKAVKKMFKRKPEYIPAVILNTFFIFLINILGENLIRRIKKRIDKAIQGKNQDAVT